MDKQRMSNILSSVQMSPRDRKDFIEELSKLGQGGAGGGTNEGGGEKEIEIVTDIDKSSILNIIQASELNKLVYLNIKIPYIINYYVAIKQGMYVCTIQVNVDEAAIIIIENAILTQGAADCFPSRVYILFDKINNIYSIYTEHRAVIIPRNDSQIGQPYYEPQIVALDTSGDRTKFLADDGNYITIIELYLTESSYSNKEAISKVSLTKDYTCQLKLSNKTLLGTYYNGTFTAFSEGKIVRYDIDSEGNVTQDLSINPELIGTVAKLEVGDADDICQRNLELINMAITQAGANHFDVDIDYGVGSATFTQGLADDAIAGTATIIVATGYVTKYNLYGNGKVEKVGNDIDLFALEARIAALEGA